MTLTKVKACIATIATTEKIKVFVYRIAPIPGIGLGHLNLLWKSFGKVLQQ